MLRTPALAVALAALLLSACAHKKRVQVPPPPTLPFSTWVRVYNLNNNKTVDVRIIDRGPFVDGRIIDLSHAAAQVIDMIGPGVAQVRLEIIRSPAPRDAG